MLALNTHSTENLVGNLRGIRAVITEQSDSLERAKTLASVAGEAPANHVEQVYVRDTKGANLRETGGRLNRFRRF